MSSKLIIILLLMVSMLFADVGVQTDWSGGPGQPGPVTEWTDSFASAYLVNWSGTPGSVMLDENAESHEVCYDSDLGWTKPCFISDDDYPDVFVHMSDGCYWYRNINGGTQFVKGSIPVEMDDIGTGDINNDGLNDIAGAYSGMPDKFIWLERISGGWVEHDISEGLYSTRNLQVLDFDGDGDIDIAGTYRDGSFPDTYYGIAWWENLGDGADWEQHVISGGPSTPSIASIDVSDYDDDGDCDVVGGIADEIYLYINMGSADGWELQVIEYPTDEYFERVTFANLDGTGSQELVTCDFSSSGDVLVFKETSPGSWNCSVLASYPFEVLHAVPSDYDGDGDTDVAVSSNAEGSSPYYLMWYENLHGDASEWLLHPVISYEEQCANPWPADFNNDGTDDLSVRYSSSSVPARTAMWWDFSPGIYHESVCFLESSILYVNDVHWNTIDWSATLPPETYIRFQVRSSDDFTSMGDWSPFITSPGSIAPYVSDGDSYIQYKAVLHTTDSMATPILNNVAVSWDPTGIEEGSEPSGLTLAPARNPSVGSLELLLGIPSCMHVRLDVYDTAGRLVSTALDGELQQEDHSIIVDDLSPGLYLARMTAGEQTITERLTVIGR